MDTAEEVAQLMAAKWGASLKANIALVNNNAHLGAEVAKAYARPRLRRPPESRSVDRSAFVT